ncbi:MAG: hypothetical protein RR361_08250, partial [Anaerovorax sp.]
HYEDYFIEDYCHSCTLSKSRELADYSAIRIGSIAHCVNCGKELYDSSTIVCECCEDDRNTCSRCGAIIDEGDEYGLPNLEIICPQCYADNFETCPHCGCVYENENMTEVHNGDFICRDCLGKSYFYCEECNEYYPLYQQDDDGLCENCTKKNEQQEAM